jgi:CO/xanthine dehydrogenase FAD-binding subunit
MKPAAFEYHAPDTLEEVLHLLAEHGDEGKIIAGGQSLVPMLSMRLARPAQLIDVNGVAALAGVELAEGALRIGATTTERVVERSPIVAPNAPALAEALPLIGHLAIRNRGTVGGSIAHADASAELPAVAMATDASMVVRGPGGERVVGADEFFVGHYSTTLADDECLVRIDIPTATASAGWAVQEVARRHGDFALVGVAAMVALGAGTTIAQARVCLFGVGERPVRAAEVEASLVGAEATPETFEAAAADAVRDLTPGGDVHGSGEYRRHLARVTVRRALATAAERARHTEEGARS